jgi:ribonuclease P protein component
MNGLKGDKNIKAALFTRYKTRSTNLTVGAFVNKGKICTEPSDFIENYLIIVPKKLFKKAHTRNKIRRRVRSVLASGDIIEQVKSLKFAQMENIGYTLTITVGVKSKDFLQLTFANLKTEVIQAVFIAIDKIA